MTMQRRPEEIIQALNSSRQRISTKLQTYSFENSRDSGNSAAPLWRTLSLVQQYLQAYVRTYITPSTVISFAAKRPVLVAVAVAAIVITGPTRLVGWAAKAAAFWRLISAVKARST